MGPSSIERGKIKLRQQKTGAELVIPIHPCLSVSLKSVPTHQETFIVNSWGKPFSNDSFGMWFKRRCVEAGVPDKSMHGLRKAAARRLAEIGLSNQMIKSVTGHTSDSEVARYTAAADQERMADAAIKSLDLANPA
jgi:integrase